MSLRFRPTQGGTERARVGQARGAMEESRHGLSAEHGQSLTETRFCLLAVECSNVELVAAGLAAARREY